MSYGLYDLVLMRNKPITGKGNMGKLLMIQDL